MRHPVSVLALALAALLALPLAAYADSHLTGLTPAVDRLFISAGCPPANPATCTSTRWLGKAPGDANTNFLTATTPVDHVLYQVDGEPNWRDYPSDDTLPDGGYVLDAAEDLHATVAVVNNVLMASNTVHARASLTTAANPFIPTQLPEQTVDVLLVNPGATEEVEFNWDLPEDLHGVTVTGIIFEVALHGVNARGGYINQSGGSFVLVPHLVE